MAKTIREVSNNTVQTSVRAGRHDYLLRKRIKGSNTPWSQVPPLVLTQELPEFEIGLYNDIVNPSNRVEGQEQQDQPITEQEMQNISEDIQKQYAAKRNRSKEEKSPRNTRQKTKETKQNESDPESSSGTGSSSSSGAESDTEGESEDEKNPKKILNSTPLPDMNSTIPIIIDRDTKTSQEPPQPAIWNTHYHSLPSTPHPNAQKIKNKKLTTVPETPHQEIVEKSIEKPNKIPETPDHKDKPQTPEPDSQDPASRHNMAAIQTPEENHFYIPVTNKTRKLDLPATRNTNAKSKNTSKTTKNHYE